MKPVSEMTLRELLLEVVRHEKLLKLPETDWTDIKQVEKRILIAWQRDKAAVIDRMILKEEKSKIAEYYFLPEANVLEKIKTSALEDELRMLVEYFRETEK